MKRKLKLVDTTLRDGEQSPGMTFSMEDKIRLALLLDKIGVHEIEAGIYDVETEGISYIRTIMEKRKHAVISIWSRLNPDDVEKAARQKPDLIHIGTPVSYTQIYSKLGKNKKWLENMLMTCLQVAKDYQIPVTVGFEDASRSDTAFMIRLMKMMREQNVERVRLADTVGILLPKRAVSMVKEIKACTNMEIEIHEHNDFGMAVANSLVMAMAGADMVDTTLYGIGERAGNCDMYEFVHSAGRKFEVGVKSQDVIQAEAFLEMMNCGGNAYDQRNIV